MTTEHAKEAGRHPRDHPGYQRSPAVVSASGRTVQVDGANVADLLRDYVKWGLIKEPKGKRK